MNIPVRIPLLAAGGSVSGRLVGKHDGRIVFRIESSDDDDDDDDENCELELPFVDEENEE